jgi:hypothetical protein
MSTVRRHVEAVQYRAHGVGAAGVLWYMKALQWALFAAANKMS